MTISKERSETMQKYARDNLKRIPLDVPKPIYERIKAHADKRGETVNGFIKRAISVQMEKEGSPLMVSTSTLERRYRYRLKQHGLILHKEKNDYGEVVYYLTDENNPDRPDDNDNHRWYNFKGIEEYCQELAEQDEIYYAEQRNERRANRD